MIAKTLVLVCAAFGLAAGSCFEYRAPQCSAPVVSVPVADNSCGDNVFSVDSSAQTLSLPVSTGSYKTVFSGIPSSVVSLPVATGASFSDAFSGSFSTAGVQASNGPETSPLQVIQAPAVTLPAVEGPVVTVSSQPIPAPRILSQRCVCTKTIVRPQVYQRQVTVPKIQRYLKRTVTPVVENVAYKSTPIAQPESASAGSFCGYSGAQSTFAAAPVVVSSGAQANYVSAPSSYVVSAGSGSEACGTQANYVSAPVVTSNYCPRAC